MVSHILMFHNELMLSLMFHIRVFFLDPRAIYLLPLSVIRISRTYLHIIVKCKLRVSDLLSAQDPHRKLITQKSIAKSERVETGSMIDTWPFLGKEGHRCYLGTIPVSNSENYNQTGGRHDV